jgi:hypothetical protein
MAGTNNQDVPLIRIRLDFLCQILCYAMIPSIPQLPDGISRFILMVDIATRVN